MSQWLCPFPTGKKKRIVEALVSHHTCVFVRAKGWQGRVPPLHSARLKSSGVMAMLLPCSLGSFICSNTAPVQHLRCLFLFSWRAEWAKVSWHSSHGKADVDRHGFWLCQSGLWCGLQETICLLQAWVSMWYRSEGQSVNGSLIKTSTKMAQSDTQSPEGPKVGPDPAPPPRAPWGPQDSGSVHLQHPPEQDVAISTALQP